MARCLPEAGAPNGISAIVSRGERTSPSRRVRRRVLVVALLLRRGPRPRTRRRRRRRRVVADHLGVVRWVRGLRLAEPGLAVPDAVGALVDGGHGRCATPTGGGPRRRRAHGHRSHRAHDFGRAACLAERGDTSRPGGCRSRCTRGVPSARVRRTSAAGTSSGSPARSTRTRPGMLPTLVMYARPPRRPAVCLDLTDARARRPQRRRGPAALHARRALRRRRLAMIEPDDPASPRSSRTAASRRRPGRQPARAPRGHRAAAAPRHAPRGATRPRRRSRAV